MVYTAADQTTDFGGPQGAVDVTIYQLSAAVGRGRGEMILAQRRHGYRPAHIHFLVGGDGYREVVTALYLANDDHIDSDTVFGVTDSLITEVQDNNPKCPLPGTASIEFNFQLAAATAADMGGRVGADPKEIVKE